MIKVGKVHLCLTFNNKTFDSGSRSFVAWADPAVRPVELGLVGDWGTGIMVPSMTPSKGPFITPVFSEVHPAGLVKVVLVIYVVDK